MLTSSAGAEEALSTELAALAVGEPLATAAAAVAGLQSAAALSESRTVLETARDLLSGDLSQFATKLRSAATQYEDTDAVASDVLGKLAGPVRYETVS